MYKVFFNHKCVILDDGPSSNITDSVLLKEIPSNLNDWIENQLLNKEIDTLHVSYRNLKKLWKAFQKSYKVLIAAGGLVQAENKYLFIKRLGKWDLPKGKLEKNENIETCAIREVQEECGLKKIEILHKLLCTYHTYEHKGKMVLKETHWYLMSGDHSEKTIPQYEEDIEQVKWKKNDNLAAVISDTYPSILQVLEEATLI